MGARSTDLTHERLWAAIDAIAEQNGLSPSALARRAGLSSTAFNKSKRVTSDGRPRWPSTESIAKILEATEADLSDLMRLIGVERPRRSGEAGAVPVLVAPQMALGFAEEAATTPGEPVRFPGGEDATLFAFRVEGGSAAPLYRAGDVLIASRAVAVQRGHRVLVHTLDGAIEVRLFLSRNGRSSEFAVPAGRRRLRLPSADVVWIARILWASQ